MGGCEKEEICGLTIGKMFGCGGLSGSQDSFHRIDLNSVNLTGYRNKAVGLATKYIFKSRHQTPPEFAIPSFRLTIQNAWEQRRRHVASVIEKYCTLNTELAVLITGPGAGSQSTQLTQYPIRKELKL